MLPDDPLFRGRLLRAARALSSWNRASLACEIGVSTAAVHAVEAGRLESRCAAALTFVTAVEAIGARFLPAVKDFKVGVEVRYASLPQRRPPYTKATPASGSEIGEQCLAKWWASMVGLVEVLVMEKSGCRGNV
jgi:DNA-binding XRE family transcriptional regulator